MCSVAVAIVGLLSALLIYATAGDDSESDADSQVIVVDGKTYRIPLASTKTYRRDLERMGGGAAVMADDLNRWFASRWRGRSLGVTVAWITAFVSLGLFLFARNMIPEQDSDGRDEHPPG
jgi:hypothetical protein